MKKTYLLSIVFIISIFTTASLSEADINIKTPSWQKVEKLMQQNNFVFLFLDDGKTPEGQEIEKVVRNTVEKLTMKAGLVKVMANDPVEKKLIEFFKVEKLPVVITVAPNGAITGVLVQSINETTLIKSLVSPKKADAILALQEGRFVFLCFYDKNKPSTGRLKSDLESIQKGFRGMLNIIYIESDDKEEEEFREEFEIDENTVVALAPPGRIVNKLKGTEITKENLIRILLSCSKGCGAGSSCCPKD